LEENEAKKFLLPLFIFYYSTSLNFYLPTYGIIAALVTAAAAVLLLSNK
jgi:hypothetical protein